jgi:hypothetical protein
MFELIILVFVELVLLWNYCVGVEVLSKWLIMRYSDPVIFIVIEDQEFFEDRW